MRAAFAAVVITFATSPAVAESDRVTALSVGVVLGIHSLPDSTTTSDIPEPAIGRIAEGFGGPRVTLGFERAPLPYPDAPGYRKDAYLVPELIGAAFVDREAGHADLMLGAGVRAELRISQRQMGLMRVSARMGIYVAARGFVVGEQRDPMGELVLGEYFLFGRARFGFEIGAMQRREAGKVEAQKGVISTLYLGGTL